MGVVMIGRRIIREISVIGEMMVGVMTCRVVIVVRSLISRINQQYNRSSGSSSQKEYTDYASSPPRDTCGKLHPSRACHRITGACFSCGLTGHMAKDCPKNDGSGSKGNGNNKQITVKGKVFSLSWTKQPTLQVPFRELSL
uniref:Zinc finger, CCHC-type, retrotransposon Gag domain protein n=1 Tax=Tanacetum cinerariifolium TaxID=118510 RepID=A0A699UJW6_TANCI|nr:zinc finger, CCHC-type, retrotransposon Gag domain protein [Tanacetum cinerariifolium]